jgi:hypothetical protein
MTVKNITGAEATLGFGKRTYTLAANAQAEVDEDPRTLKMVSQHLSKGRIEIVKGSNALDLGHAAAAPSHLLIHVKAVGDDGDTITITPSGEFNQIFEMDPTPVAAIEGATAVDIGADAATTADNLKAAINANTVLTKVGIVADEVVDNGTGEAWVLVKATGSAALEDATVAASAAARIDISSVAANPHQTVSQQVIHVAAVGDTILVLPTSLGSILHHTLVHLDVNGDPAGAQYDGTVTYFDGAIFFDDDGAADLAADDQLIVTVYGK